MNKTCVLFTDHDDVAPERDGAAAPDTDDVLYEIEIVNENDDHVASITASDDITTTSVLLLPGPHVDTTGDVLLQNHSTPPAVGISNTGGDTAEASIVGVTATVGQVIATTEEVTTSPMKKFKCSICTSSFTTKSNLKRHEKSHDGTKPICSLCDKSFFNLYDLRQHEDVEHKGIRFRCDETSCNKAFKSKYAYRLHVASHYGNESHLCPHCGQKFMYKNTFLAHLSRHERKPLVSCEKCGKSFTMICSLSKHKAICGVSNKAFQCPTCSKKFKAKRYLDDHEKMHSKPDRYICETCGNMYNSRGGLYNHRKNKHTEQTDSQ